MNISKEQKRSLKTYLDKQLKYRETFDEVYDHVLTAMENMPERMDFETAYHSYINTEFGGEAGLQAIERRNRREIFKTMRMRYFTCLRQQLHFPMVFMWVLIVFGSYLVFNAKWFHRDYYFNTYATLALMSGLLYGYRYFKTGFVFKNKKASVADEVFRWLKYLQRFTLASFVFLSVFFGTDFIADLMIVPATAAVFLAAYLLHFNSVYKLYKHEFKVILAK